MIKWYDRIGNTIEMRVGNKWIKGIIIKGERIGDGIIIMETLDGKKYWCGVGGEYIHFRKCDDSDGDFLSNADRIRSMSDEELARDLIPLIEEICDDGIPCEELFLSWLQQEAE